MKICNFFLGCIVLFVIACGDDSSSAFNAWSENQFSSSSHHSGLDPESSSSSWIAPSSSNSRNDVSSSSSSSWSGAIGSSSSSKVPASAESGRSKPVEGSSSSAKKLSGEVPGDPLQIFKTRVPKKAVYHCDMTEKFGRGFEGDFDQKDWICTFKYAGMEGYVYVQASPTGCSSPWGFYPDMSVDSAVIYVNGKYETLNGVTYDWGGNHHADSFRFSYDGKVFEYSHSSINFAYRPCQEMDCLRVYEADGRTLIENGCSMNGYDLSKDRQLPVVCRFANLEDGSFGDFADNFELCPGDSRLSE